MGLNNMRKAACSMYMHCIRGGKADYVKWHSSQPQPTPSNEVIPANRKGSVDDHLTDEDKICGVSLQKLKGRAAIEAAFAHTGVTITPEIISRVVGKESLGGQALLTFFAWAGKQPNCQHDLNSYHNILNALGRRKCFGHMEELLQQMNKEGLLPTPKTMGIVMNRYVKANRLGKAVATFERMQEFGLKSDTISFNILLHALCQENHTRFAHSLFNTIRRKISPDNITYTILIGGWSKHGRMREVYKVLNEMIRQGLEADCITYNYVLDGLSRAGRIEEAIKLLDSMAEKGCPPATINYNTMIHSLCLTGSLNEGLKRYDEMPAKGCTPDITTYALLIRSLLKVRRVADALVMFDRMLDSGFIPEESWMKLRISCKKH